MGNCIFLISFFLCLFSSFRAVVWLRCSLLSSSQSRSLPHCLFSMWCVWPTSAMQQALHGVFVCLCIVFSRCWHCIITDFIVLVDYCSMTGIQRRHQLLLTWLREAEKVHCVCLAVYTTMNHFVYGGLPQHHFIYIYYIYIIYIYIFFVIHNSYTDGFTGIYSSMLSHQCWSADSQRVLISSAQRSRKVQSPKETWIFCGLFCSTFHPVFWSVCFVFFLYLLYFVICVENCMHLVIKNIFH